MINIPKIIETSANKSKKPSQNPLNISSKTKRFNIRFVFIFSYKTFGIIVDKNANKIANIKLKYISPLYEIAIKRESV